MIRNFRLLDLLPSMDPDEQLEVFERVLRSPRPQVRQKALGVGAAILSDSRLLEYLRQEDDVHRNAAVEMLKLRRQRSLNLACYLLNDRDTDVVLQAVKILGHLRDRAALEALVKALAHDDRNVVQEVLVALGKLGDNRALPAVLPCLKQDVWIKAAAIEALGRIGDSAAAPELERLLDDDNVAPYAVDALVRIGGAQALRGLAAYWLRHEEELDKESTLRCLADLLEELARPPEGLEELEQVLREKASDQRKGVRLAAVRSLMALRGKNRSLMMF